MSFTNKTNALWFAELCTCNKFHILSVLIDVSTAVVGWTYRDEIVDSAFYRKWYCHMIGVMLVLKSLHNDQMKEVLVYRWRDRVVDGCGKKKRDLVRESKYAIWDSLGLIRGIVGWNRSDMIFEQMCKTHTIHIWTTRSHVSIIPALSRTILHSEIRNSKHELRCQ